MKTNYLLAYSFKKWGWGILIPSAILGLVVLVLDLQPEFSKFFVPVLISDQIISDLVIFDMQEQNILDEVLGGFVILGSMMVAFSKEKVEDEYIAKIRLDSLAWAVYFNQGLLLVSLFFVYGMLLLLGWRIVSTSTTLTTSKRSIFATTNSWKSCLCHKLQNINTKLIESVARKNINIVARSIN
jgi:hypothetical protein